MKTVNPASAGRPKTLTMSVGACRVVGSRSEVDSVDMSIAFFFFRLSILTLLVEPLSLGLALFLGRSVPWRPCDPSRDVGLYTSILHFEVRTGGMHYQHLSYAAGCSLMTSCCYDTSLTFVSASYAHNTCMRYEDYVSILPRGSLGSFVLDAMLGRICVV